MRARGGDRQRAFSSRSRTRCSRCPPATRRGRYTPSWRGVTARSGCRSRARRCSRSTSTRASRPTIPPRFAARLNDELYRHVDLPRDARARARRQAADLDGACARYEREIAAAGGLDLCVLGIGGNGHIAFNEPGSPFDSRTRVVDLAEETRAASAGAVRRRAGAGARAHHGHRDDPRGAPLRAARLRRREGRRDRARAPGRRRRRRCPRRRCSCTRTRRSSSTRPPRLGWSEASMRCTGCGAEMRDEAAGCLGLYHELSVHTLSDRDPTFPHQLAVDAYAAQHAGADAEADHDGVRADRPLPGQRARLHRPAGAARAHVPGAAPAGVAALLRRRRDVGDVTVADVLAAGDARRATKRCGAGRRPCGRRGATSTNRSPRWFAIASIDVARRA